MRYYEDFSVGDQWTHGSYEMTEAEIVDFATDYDPQPFHVDPAAAAESIYGGIIASGWHTAAVAMRLAVDGLLSETATAGSPGLDGLRWETPVRPGDELSIEIEITSKRASESRPRIGILGAEWRVHNRSERVATIECPMLVEREEA